VNRTSMLRCIVIAGLFNTGVGFGQSALFVTTTNFETGSTAFLPAGADEAEVNLLTIHGDAAVRFQRGKVYVINRLGQDNILVLDPRDLRQPELQFSVGNGSNPYDIEVISESKAYVSRLARTELLIVDPRSGRELGTVDLASFGDADGFPEMAEMVVVGSRLYVACQLLDTSTFAPAPQGLIVVVDIETDRIVDMDPDLDGAQGWTLAAGNPLSLVALGNQLFVSETAAFLDTEGGIEVIDLPSGPSRGLVVTEAALGGDVGALDMVNPTRGYIVVSDASFANHVVPFDLATGAVGEPLAGHSSGFTPSIAVDGNRLVVADTGTFDGSIPAGLLIFDVDTNMLTAGPISTGLPPSDIAVLNERSVLTAVGSVETSLPGRFALDAVYPNPFNAEVSIAFEVAAGQPMELAVFDLLGRRLNVLTAGYARSGSQTIVWNGLDATGTPASSGVYLLRLRQGSLQISAKVALVK
jgi:DNA-binding beta-propeller fold protein YncE